MLYLTLITFGVFLIFWLGDFYLTIKTTKFLNNNIEMNPVIKFLLKGRGKFIYLFKFLELMIFLYLLWFLNRFSGETSFKILLFFILIYSLLVINNSHIYYKVTKKETIALRVIFLCLVLAVLLFMYLNYMLYLDLGTAYDALDTSNEKYNQLYITHYSNVSDSNLSSIPDINLSIRRTR
jgi:hypothetical protein